MGFELGGLHVPDPACGKNLARLEAGRADIDRRQKEQYSRLDRHTDPARRDRAAILNGSDSRSPDSHIQRALAPMADMRFLEADHQRAEFRQAEPMWHLAPQHAALGFGP